MISQNNSKLKILLKYCFTRLSREGPVVELRSQSPSSTVQLNKIVQIAIFHEEITENNKIYGLPRNH